MILASAIVLGLAVYAILGIVFAAWFLARAIGRLDHAAAGAGWGFRLMIAPGVVALWPVLLRRVVSAARGAPATKPAGSGAHA